MRAPVPSLPLVVALSVLLLATTAAAGDQELVKTDRYRIYGVQTPLLKKIAATLERSYTDFESRFATPRKPGGKMAVRIFPSGTDIAKAMGTDAVRESYDGLYSPDKHELWLSGSMSDETLLETVRHEGFHQFVDFNFGDRLPHWLNEGLAMYFETAQLVKDRFQLGWAKAWMVDDLDSTWATAKRPKLSWLVATDYDAFHKQGDEGSNYYYSWLLVYYLVQEGPRGQAALNAFIAERLKNAKAEFAPHLGDLARAEAGMREALDALVARRKAAGEKAEMVPPKGK